MTVFAKIRAESNHSEFKMTLNTNVILNKTNNAEVFKLVNFKTYSKARVNKKNVI